MGEAKRGVIVYLREGSVGVGHQDRNRPAQDGEGHEEARRRESEWREIGLGAQILKDLGISSIKLLASRERHYVGLRRFRHQDRQHRDHLSGCSRCSALLPRMRRISSIAASRCGSFPAE